VLFYNELYNSAIEAANRGLSAAKIARVLYEEFNIPIKSTVYYWITGRRRRRREVPIINPNDKLGLIIGSLMADGTPHPYGQLLRVADLDYALEVSGAVEEVTGVKIIPRWDGKQKLRRRRRDYGSSSKLTDSG